MPNTSSTHVGVFVTRSLDRELVSEYQFLVKATNLDEHAQESTTVVRVVVNDINDNAPHFQKKIYYVSILENATLGQLVFVLEAVDDDALFNANISYKLMGGSGTNTFSLDQTSGNLSLIMIRFSDFSHRNTWKYVYQNKVKFPEDNLRSLTVSGDRRKNVCHFKTDISPKFWNQFHCITRY